MLFTARVNPCPSLKTRVSTLTLKTSYVACCYGTGEPVPFPQDPSPHADSQGLIGGLLYARVNPCPSLKTRVPTLTLKTSLVACFYGTGEPVPFPQDRTSHADSQALVCGLLYGTSESVPFQEEWLFGRLRLTAEVFYTQ